jgi:hypothetical protein
LSCISCTTFEQQAKSSEDDQSQFLDEILQQVDSKFVILEIFLTTSISLNHHSGLFEILEIRSTPVSVHNYSSHASSLSSSAPMPMSGSRKVGGSSLNKLLMGGASEISQLTSALAQVWETCHCA